MKAHGPVPLFEAAAMAKGIDDRKHKHREPAHKQNDDDGSVLPQAVNKLIKVVAHSPSYTMALGSAT